MASADGPATAYFGYQRSIRPAAAGLAARSAGVARYTLAMIGAEAPSRKSSMRLRVATNDAARSGNGRLADDDEEPHSVADHRRQLIRLVADSGVVGDGDPFAPAHLGQPVFVRALGREVIAVALDGEARGRQDGREERAEVAISEEDKRQAARS